MIVWLNDPLITKANFNFNLRLCERLNLVE